MEDFVTFEIAKKLKEKGFKEQCLAYYTKDSDFYYNTSYGSDVENAFKSFNSRPNHICGKRIDAPIIYQVLKWLREEKNISIEVSIHCSLKWMCGIYDFSDGIADFTQYDYNGIDDTVYILYDSYEQAALAGIEYVLDNLI